MFLPIVKFRLVQIGKEEGTSDCRRARQKLLASAVQRETRGCSSSKAEYSKLRVSEVSGSKQRERN